jgi:alkylation response protein AidB-like acyl-CoA dehydrogenase
MNVAFTPEQEAWRQEVVAFLEAELTPEFIAEVELEDAASSYASPEFSRKLADRGWLTLHWPKRYGGLERPFVDQAILNEQLGFFRAPVGHHNIATEWVALPIMEFGTEEQKQRLLPPISRAQVSYAPTLTEPDAGSDLANVRTKAVRDGEDYVLDGIKVFITPAHRADYLWTLAVTNPDEERHRKFSMFVVDAKAPGVTIRGVESINHGRINDVYFDAVRVPAANRIGDETDGWKIAVTTLNLERSGIYYVSANQMWLRELISWARETTRHGRPLADDPIIRRQLAYWATELESQRMLSWRIVWIQSTGVQPSTEASVQSLRVRAYEHQFANFCMEVLGMYGLLAPGERWAPLRGRIEKLYLTSSAQHAGGTTEVQRTIIARQGLNLPRK